MNLFDQKIKSKLASPPIQEPDDEIWGRVSRGREAVTTSGTQWRWLILIAALFLLTAVGAYWLGGRNADQNVEIPPEELTNTSGRLESVPIIIDTIFLRDTIWKIVSINNQVKAPPGAMLFSSLLGTSRLHLGRDFLPSSDNSKATLGVPFIDRHFVNRSLGSRLSRLHTLKGKSLQGNLPLADSTINLGHGPNPSLLSTRDFSLLAVEAKVISLHSYQALAVEEIIRIEKKNRFWRSILPNGHRLGLVFGGLNPLIHDVEYPNEWMVGAVYDISFSHEISFVSGISNRSFSGKHEEDFEDHEFPVPDALLAGDEIHEVYVTNKYVDIPLIIKYSMPIPSKFIPYAQGGMLLSRSSSQKYEFEVRRNGKEIKLFSDRSRGPFILSSFVAGLGMSYRPYPRISTNFDIEGRYNFKISSMESNKYNGIGLRFRLLYDL